MSSTLHARTSHPVGWIIAAVAALALAVALLATMSASRPGTVSGEADRAVPAADEGVDRGAGDPCALRYETGGGFLEGIDRSNSCDPVTNSAPVTGGRLP